MVGNQKKGIYVIKDDIFDFWFNFVFHNREQINRGNYFPPTAALNRFFGKKFEDICKEEVVLHLGSSYSKFGRWWYKDPK